MEDLLPNVSLMELDLFLRVSKLKSLREAARQLDLTPGAVSKILKRLEEKMGISLFHRSTSGIVLTSDGNELIQVAESLGRMMGQVSPRFAGKHSTKEKVWGIGSISFISTKVISQCVHVLSKQRAHTRFRIVEFTHNELVSHGLNGAFEIAIHIGPLEWTRVWSSHEVGKIRWGLFARANHPLCALESVSESDAIQYPFTMPTGWSPQGFTRGEDFCPVPWGVRFPGHEAVTAETSLELVSSSEQLTFVPAIIAKRSVDAGLIEEIEVEEWPVVERKIYLSVRDDMISKPFLQSLTKVFGEVLI